ncbi:MAG TPA: hypothetical protein VFQ91_06435 [Bryobacteraceae bacterium]|nr:hypothetical protein [Bryobacteraceae bacterium]
MSHTIHTDSDHIHVHGPGCGHTAVEHEGHVDYLHDGHMHNHEGDHYVEHALGVSEQNPDDCTAGHSCAAHGPDHVHGPHCGHERVPHGDHVDYLVEGHLHHPHGGHCDNHGAVTLPK